VNKAVENSSLKAENQNSPMPAALGSNRLIFYYLAAWNFLVTALFKARFL
jgi:hypothetical protein